MLFLPARKLAGPEDSSLLLGIHSIQEVILCSLIIKNKIKKTVTVKKRQLLFGYLVINIRGYTKIDPYFSTLPAFFF